MRLHFGRRHGCDAPRIAAERAEQQALEELLRVFRDAGLVRAGLHAAAEAIKAERPRIGEELEEVRAEIARTADAVKRYQLAFEDGTMAAEDCAPRLRELNGRIGDLRLRETELEEAEVSQIQAEVTNELLDEAAGEIKLALLGGSPAQKKALLRKLFHEIDTDGQRAWPKYRVPMQGVRIVGTLVGPAGSEPTASRL
jgi:site-specific DNA recombinase